MSILRSINFAVLFSVSALLFCGCKKEAPIVIPEVNDTSINVVNYEGVYSYLEQEATIKYTINNDLLTPDTTFTATSNVSWVSIINSSEIGAIEIHIDRNDGERRVAEITISAPGYDTTTTSITQLGLPTGDATHTLMFFFCGTSLNRFFKKNLEDAIVAIKAGVLGNNRVVIFRQDTSTKAYINELYYDEANNKCVETRIRDISPITKNQVLSPEEISHYISLMAAVAPAERYGLVMAGHGHGWITREIIESDSDISTYSAGYNPWIPAAGAEVTRDFGESNVRMNIDEIAEGIALSGVELDYILFDACFMSNIEAIYDLRNSANYIIASPTEIMGNGFPYHRTLPYLFNNYGESSDYVGAAESYYKFYRDEYVSNYRCGSVTVYDCSKIEALATATREVVKSASYENINTSKLQFYEGQPIHFFYDFGEWVNVIATDDVALKNFNTTLDECVVKTFSLDSFYSAYGNSGTYPIDLDVYSGVTTSAPSTAFPNGWMTTNWYNDVIKLEN